MRQWSVLFAALLCLLSGCAPHAREPEGLALVRVLGVDGGSGVTLTAVCGSEDGREPVRGTVSAPEFASARNQLPWSGERELALTNLSCIIINKEAVLEEVLAAILNDQEMSPSATVWYAEDAAKLLEACGDPVGRLQMLSDQGVFAPTVVEALAELKETGAVCLPELCVDHGMLKKGGMVLWGKTE